MDSEQNLKAEAVTEERQGDKIRSRNWFFENAACDCCREMYRAVPPEHVAIITCVEGGQGCAVLDNTLVDLDVFCAGLLAEGKTVTHSQMCQACFPRYFEFVVVMGERQNQDLPSRLRTFIHDKRLPFLQLSDDPIRRRKYLLLKLAGVSDRHIDDFKLDRNDPA
ncbi:hypothetical protein NLN82_25410 [Citrobacter portucalensis]|uniref:hypothetical protein n=1 Tax=Citrobacter portucalensis TaxID=1639133 RepID=UPI00226B9727|nr:hypothetical protein [Citrobacter portucalensis]MCX9039349.1 hypothetical protein [Citrobacter portucalensis]